MNIEEVRLTLVEQLLGAKIPPQAIPDISEKLVSYIFNGNSDKETGLGECKDQSLNTKELDIEFIYRLRGRARFCRDRGEVKTPDLLEQAADFLENKKSPPKKP